MKFKHFILLITLISWPLIFIILFFTFARSMPFGEAIVFSIFLSGFPFFISISLIYNIYRLTKRDPYSGYGHYSLSDEFQIYFPKFKQEFNDLEELQKVIKEKREELVSLNNVHFKSYIVDIMRKDLKSELKYLKRKLIGFRNE